MSELSLIFATSGIVSLTMFGSLWMWLRPKRRGAGRPPALGTQARIDYFKVKVRVDRDEMLEAVEAWKEEFRT